MTLQSGVCTIISMSSTTDIQTIITETAARFPRNASRYAIEADIYEEDGIVFENVMGQYIPLRSTVEGRLGDLLLAAAEWGSQAEIGREAVAEMTAEYASSWVSSGFDPADASAFAGQETRSIRAIQVEADHYARGTAAALEDEFPHHGPWEHQVEGADQPF